jgi:pre-mRNA-splicing factor CWC22
MIIDCCMNERTYLRFFGLLAQRFCDISEIFRDNFMKGFVNSFAYVHRLETGRIRNCAKLFAHLFFTDAIDWRVLNCITLTQESTTSGSRIFIKNLIQEVILVYFF